MTTLVAFIVAIGLLVFIHEMGHYLVARWCGVKVLQFSIGFGPSLYERTSGPDKTLWTIAAIPLGGYVKMLDEEVVEAEGSEPIPNEVLHRAFNRQSLTKRSLIVLAGPVANFLFAIAAYAVLNFSGILEPVPQLVAPQSGTVAAEQGVLQGDKIVAIDGNAVASWNQVRLELLEAAIDKREVELRLANPSSADRNIKISTRDLTPADLDKDFLKTLGLELERGPISIGELAADGAASAAGLQSGDAIVAVNGQSKLGASALVELIRSSGGKELSFSILRGNTPLQMKVTPKLVDGLGKIGAGLNQQPIMAKTEMGPIQSVAAGVKQTWDMSIFSLRMLGKMIVGNLSWKNLSGPITIADYAGKTAKIGWEAYLGLLALISVSLGVLNLLPIPVLDGGHLVYYGLEAIRGKPLPKRVMEVSRSIGVALIGLMMIVAIGNDIIRKLS